MLMTIVMVMASIVRVYKIREENANPGKGQSFQTQDELPCCRTTHERTEISHKNDRVPELELNKNKPMATISHHSKTRSEIVDPESSSAREGTK